MAKFMSFLLAVLTIGVGIVILRRLRSPEEMPALVDEQPLAA